MKYAITTTADEAAQLQSADDDAAGLPWPGVYLDGSPAPEGQGVTEHLYAPRAKPDGTAWAYPVQDDATPTVMPAIPGGHGPRPDISVQPVACECVDALDDSWTVAIGDADLDPAQIDPAPVQPAPGKLG
jgi:hypothetical protein